MSYSTPVSSISAGVLDVVRADFNSHCHSPALYGRLFGAADRDELAAMAAGWVSSLVALGANERHAATFVMREAARVLESISTVDLCHIVEPFTMAAE